MSAQIFISYRRTDSLSSVKSFQHDLYESLNLTNKVFIFRDEGGIIVGSDWKESIQTELAKSQIVLVIIGPNWMELDSNGKRRIDDPKDFVYREVLFALNNHKMIFPVLLDGGIMPDKNKLPKKIQKLADLQGQEVNTKSPDKVQLLIFYSIIQVALSQEENKQKKKEEGFFGEIVAKDGSKINVQGVSPEVGLEGLKNIPIYGKWRITVTSPKGVSGGTGKVKISLKDDFVFSGHYVYRKSFLRKGRHRMDGTWGLLTGDNSLVLTLDGIWNRAEPFKFNMPINKRAGKGYTGVDSEGRTYFFESLGGSVIPKSGQL